jgi:putative NIF3 family GTP cyclohydrolase 1 type 2
MTAREVNTWLRALHPVPEPSVDRIIVGSPEAAVRGIAVVWMPTWAALRDAERCGCNVVIAHEPTFFSHHDLDGFESTLPEAAGQVYGATRDAKRRWIEERGLVVIRCHDVLDAMPEGVVDALVAGLGFSTEAVQTRWQRYRVVRLAKAMTAERLARRLATRFARLRQPGVTFYGDPHRKVGSLGLGTGYGCEPWRFVELGADMGLTIDDRIKTWCEAEWADDSGFPLAVVHHGVTEEWGVRRLTARLAAAFPELRVELVKQGFTGQWVTAQRSRKTDEPTSRARVPGRRRASE